MLTFSLPIAPSSNNAWMNRKAGRGYGRIKSANYRNWVKQADAYYTLQCLGNAAPIRGPYTCRMVFPQMRGDLDSRAKLILDWIVSRGLTSDDKFLQNLELKKDSDHHGLVWITVKHA